MRREFNVGDNIIDSRDINAWYEELQDKLIEIQDRLEEQQVKLAELAVELANCESDEAAVTQEIEAEIEDVEGCIVLFAQELEEFHAEYDEELNYLEEAIEDGKHISSDWDQGETLIHEDYFTQYAREYAEDIGAIDRDDSWPCNHIDWEAAAEELLNEYSSITVGDHVYYLRYN